MVNDSVHYLSELRSIRGYRASGIMSFTGQILVSDSIDPKINLAAEGLAFNDTFLVAHEATAEVGLEAANEICIETPQQWIAMLCSGPQARTHIHLLTILDKEGNLALVRMSMEKLLPRLMDDDALMEQIKAFEQESVHEIDLATQHPVSVQESLETVQGEQPSGTSQPISSRRRKAKAPKATKLSRTDGIPDLVEILVVHDSSVVGKKMELEFDKLNILPDFADSIEKATRLLDRKRYHAVFCGITLPDGNGYQICRMINKDPNKKHCIVVSLTASPSPYERVRSKLAGFDNYFSVHAITSEKLESLVKSHLKAKIPSNH